jgi:UDP-2-acetamido-3-amino-2,3-dideoxy-glucuronate N-acetyltransferase
MTTDTAHHRPGIAVIGSGYWGKNLVRNFHSLGVLKLICDRNASVLQEFKQQFPQTDTCVALSDVLQREDVEGVVVATPAETHFAIAREALFSGKHVFVEKPLVLNEKEGSELIAIAKNADRVLMVGHLIQYHPAFVRLKEMVMAGDLGRINYIYSHRLNFGKIRREENILWSFAPHDISMILSLAGEEPERLLTTGGYYLHQRIADVTTTHFEFPSGLHAHVFVSWLHPFKEQKLVVVGDRKMAVFDDTMPWPDKLLIYPHHVQWVNSMPVPTKAEPSRSEYPHEEPLKNECLHFLDCISTGRRPLTDGHEGLRVLRILKASQESLDLRGKKIQLADEPLAAIQPSATPASPGDTAGIAPGAFVHDTALVDAGAVIGAGTKIWHFSHVLAGSRIGERCNVGQNVVIGPEVTIGAGCKIQNNVSVYKGVTLEDGVFCGPSMVFTNVFNPRAGIRRMDQIRPTLVRQGATIGANATIVCGVTIGRYCFIGAGAVVTRNVPDYALAVGNPAKPIGWMCECGERLTEMLHCLTCGKQYDRCDLGLVPRVA